MVAGDVVVHAAEADQVRAGVRGQVGVDPWRASEQDPRSSGTTPPVLIRNWPKRGGGLEGLLRRDVTPADAARSRVGGRGMTGRAEHGRDDRSFGTGGRVGLRSQGGAVRGELGGRLIDRHRCVDGRRLGGATSGGGGPGMGGPSVAAEVEVEVARRPRPGSGRSAGVVARPVGSRWRARAPSR